MSLPLRFLAILFLAACCLDPPAALGQAPAGAPKQDVTKPDPAKPEPVPRERRGSGLKVPRFATMRAEEVNVRTGPGTRYPVEWIFEKRGMPVEVIAEFDNWRRIRDWQGASGWVHQSMLIGKRSLVVTAKEAPLLADAKQDGALVARVEQGVVGEIISCKEAGYCRVRIDNYRGYLARANFWGLYPDEKLE
jgi:SH3-like domain-containing protein